MFSSESKSLSIDNAVLGPISTRLLFTMIQNTDFLGSLDTNRYRFKPYDHSNFALYVNGKLIPSEGLSVDTGHEKTSSMAYRTLFDRTGIHHSNSGLQMCIAGYFMLLFDLTPDRAASEGHTSHPNNGILE
jgi:hypothetical protein